MLLRLCRGRVIPIPEICLFMFLALLFLYPKSPSALNIVSEMRYGSDPLVFGFYGYEHSGAPPVPLVPPPLPLPVAVPFPAAWSPPAEPCRSACPAFKTCHLLLPSAHKRVSCLCPKLVLSANHFHCFCHICILPCISYLTVSFNWLSFKNWNELVSEGNIVSPP